MREVAMEKLAIFCDIETNTVKFIATRLDTEIILNKIKLVE